MTNEEHALLEKYLSANDFSANTEKAIRLDLLKWERWFQAANGETYDARRATPRDVADFRRHLREVRRQAVATINRCLVTVRGFLGFLQKEGFIDSNPAEGVQVLRRTEQAPKAIERTKVRKILREASICEDTRFLAIASLMLYCGLRVGEVAALELDDLDVSDRSGTIRVRDGKGRKERQVPMPNEVRKPVARYLAVRGSRSIPRLFLGRDGSPLGTDGMRYLVKKYGLRAGIRLHPHALRHTMATEYLQSNANDIVGLAQILGHENVQTTSKYTRRTSQALADASDRILF